MLGWLALFSVLLGGFFFYLVLGGGVESMAGLPVAVAVALALVALYAVATGSLRDGGQFRRLAGPVIVILCLAAGALYALPKLDLNPLLATLAGNGETAGNETAAAAQSLKSVRIRRDGEGRFIARGDLNGAQATFLIDTGATAIVLRQSDAERAGIDTSGLAYSVPVKTANGETNTAAVRLRSLTVGSIRMEGLEALVASPGSLNENLLGMTFLRRLRSYDLSGDFITLRE